MLRNRLKQCVYTGIMVGSLWTSSLFAAEITHPFLKEWSEALASRNPDRIVALYQPEAVLLATLKDDPVIDQTTRQSYFAGLMQKDGLKVVVDKEMVRSFQDVDVISGVYKFQFTDKGKPVTVPARYSFVVQKNKEGQWLAIDHHSSQLPGTLKK